MGNAESNIIPNQPPKDNEIDVLVENITRSAKKLWREYHANFLDRDFCNNIELAYKDKLKNLTIQQLKGINNEINKSDDSKFEVHLKYKPRADQKFIVDELKTELVDLFYNRMVQFNTDKVQLSKFLENMKYIKSIQKGGQNTNIQNELTKLLQEEKNKNKNNNTKNNTKNNNTKNNNTTNKNNKNNNNNIDNNVDDKSVAELDDLISELRGNKPKKINRKDRNKREKKIDKKEEQNNKNNREKVINIQLNKVNQIMNKNNNNKYINKSNKEYNSKAYRFPTCNNTSARCELTKDELCKAISRNYMVRSNIIAAILSTLPSKDDRGKYIPGFCQSRLKSLDTFKICLPPGFKDLSKLPKEKRLQELVRYIDNVDEYHCHNIGGYYKSLSKREIDALMTGNNEFNIFYKRFTQQLRNQYTESLRSLVGILELLENETTIKNSTLNEISDKAKEIIDDMYTKCQMNYIYAILAYLRADVETTQETLDEEKAIVDTLQQGLF